MVSRKQNTRTGKKNGSALAGGSFEEFVHWGLVGFGLFGGDVAELAEKFWGDVRKWRVASGEWRERGYGRE